jgi:hypothetical protein
MLKQFKDSQLNTEDKTGLTQQAETHGRWSSFGKTLRDHIRGEKVTNISFLHHLPVEEAYEPVANFIDSKKPNLIIVDMVKNESLDKVLNGKIPIKKLLDEFPNISEYTASYIGYLVELHKKGVKIERFKPIENEKTIEELSKKLADMDVKLLAKINGGEFDDALKIKIEMAKLEAGAIRSLEQLREKEIVDKVKSGEWKGNIVIESDSRTKTIVMKELEGIKNIHIDSFYYRDKNVEEVFGEGILQRVGGYTELKNLYIFGKPVTPEKERLLAARSTLAEMLSEVPTPSDPKLMTLYQAVKLAEQLDEDECRKIFNEISRMSKEKAREFVSEYLKKRAEGNHLEMFAKHEELPKKTLPSLEKETAVTLFYEYHTMSCHEELKKYLESKKPDVVILENEKDPRFPMMLEGRMSIDEYTEWSISKGFMFTDINSFKENCKMLRELHQKEHLQVEQIAPGWVHAFPEMNQNIVMMKSVMDKNFEYAVGEFLKFAKANAEWMGDCEAKRGKEIADKIKRGELHGDILIQSGAAHRILKHALEKELTGTDVKVNPFYAFKEASERFLGHGISYIHMPQHELATEYLGDKQPTQERERLLAARQVIFALFPESVRPTSGRFEMESRMMELVKIVNQLPSYEICKELFLETNVMGRDVKLEFISAYVKKMNGVQLAKASDKSYALLGNPLENVRIDEKDHLVKGSVGHFNFYVNDDKEVNITVKGNGLKEWSARYRSAGFELLVPAIKNRLAIQVEEGTPYFLVQPLLSIEPFKKAGVKIENEEMWNRSLLGISEMKQSIDLYKQKKFDLNPGIVNLFEMLLKHEKEILEATSLYEDANKLKHHPKVEEIFERRIDRFIERMKTKGA